MKRGATKEEIIRITQALIARNGIRAVRVDEIAQSVESIGREGIQAAALRLRGDRQRQPYRESRSDDDLLAILHYIQEFGSGRKPPGRKLQISYFLVFWQKNRSLRR